MGKKEKDKVVLTPREVKKDILLGRRRDFAGVTIKGDLSLVGSIIEGSLYLIGVTIEGYLDFRGATINGDLFLDGSTIKHSLDFRKAAIIGRLSLATKKGPLKILVSQIDAQRIHYAAPTVPLVIGEEV